MKYINLIKNEYTKKEISSLSPREKEELLNDIHGGFEEHISIVNSNLSDFVNSLSSEDKNTFYSLNVNKWAAFFEDKGFKLIQEKGIVIYDNFNAELFQNLLKNKSEVLLSFASSLDEELKLKHIRGIFQSEFEVGNNKFQILEEYIRNDIFKNTIRTIKES